MVASVGRAFRLLDTFGGMGTVLGVSEIARRAGLHKTTAYRLLTQLVESGYVMRSGELYRLSLHTFTIGNRYANDRSKGLRELSAPHLGDLFLQSGFIVTLATLDGPEVVFLEKLQSTRAPATPAVAGGRFPAHASALGKALLAFSDPRTVGPLIPDELAPRTPLTITGRDQLIAELGRVRTAGVAFDHQEAALGLLCVAAPVLVDGAARAAVSVSGPADAQFRVAAFADLVRAAARSIAVAMAWERKQTPPH